MAESDFFKTVSQDPKQRAVNLLAVEYIRHIRQFAVLIRDKDTRVVRKRRFPMIFHNEKQVYWH
jgi:hypothetical protein